MVNARVWKRGKDTWCLILDGEDRLGNRKTKWQTFRTKKEADEALREALRQDEEHALSSTNLTVGEWLERWGKDYLVSQKASTKKNYATAAKKFTGMIGHVKLDKLRTPQIQTAISSMLDAKMSPNTIRTYVTCLGIALRQAVESGLIKRDPTQGAKLPAGTRKKVTPMQAEDLARILEALEGSQYKLPVIIAIATGMRRIECLRRTWEDVDLERGTISIPETKTEAGRRLLYLPAFALDAVKAERKHQAAMRLKWGKDYKNSNLVCCQEDGSPLSLVGLSHKFTRTVRSLGIEATFHDTRHTYASMLLKAGINIKVIQECLGHSNIQQTMNTYAHLYAGAKEEVATKVDEMLSVAIGCKS